ncbi:hypothetical protein [Coleofasciculus sp. F4-SAH-05]|uniref:hypothetical protein n=1 Tax=Coleofasciculus sp. F4-SAH-05 TaxID=3069525 RepID=UPI0033014EB3
MQERISWTRSIYLLKPGRYAIACLDGIVPQRAQLEEIATVEYLWGRLLDTIWESCPDNRERDQAIVHLESVREWMRK